MHFLLSRYCPLTFVRRQVVGRILNMCFAHMRPPFAVTLSSQNDFYMFISVFIICFLLYHMSPRDSVMTCARISVPHLLEHFSLFLTFPPTRSFSSCPRLEQLPLFSLFCPNSLFLFLSTIGAASPFFSLLPQLSSIFAQPTLIDCKLLW